MILLVFIGNFPKNILLLFIIYQYLSSISLMILKLQIHFFLKFYFLKINLIQNFFVNFKINF
ncbi:hypothetical protein OC709_02190 ['Planchonia careya' phytoplasma]|nr:hypothetical protein ['Planchonia careya' phytoplasma]MDO8030308.1 hypothetical protein ['Planchonia careya' phytoplasma]